MKTVKLKKSITWIRCFEAKRFKICFERALSALDRKSANILEIKQQIISLVLKRTVIRALRNMDQKNATALINETIKN
jgi:hypothetical protein